MPRVTRPVIPDPPGGPKLLGRSDTNESAFGRFDSQGGSGDAQSSRARQSAGIGLGRGRSPGLKTARQDEQDHGPGATGHGDQASRIKAAMSSSSGHGPTLTAKTPQARSPQRPQDDAKTSPRHQPLAGIAAVHLAPATAPGHATEPADVQARASPRARPTAATRPGTWREPEPRTEGGHTRRAGPRTRGGRAWRPGRRDQAEPAKPRRRKAFLRVREVERKPW
jgi:hypothetical protein